MARVSYVIFHEQQETKGQGNALALPSGLHFRRADRCVRTSTGVPFSSTWRQLQLRAGQGSISSQHSPHAAPALSCPHWCQPQFLTRLMDVPSRLPAQGENWEHI